MGFSFAQGSRHEPLCSDNARHEPASLCTSRVPEGPFRAAGEALRIRAGASVSAPARAPDPRRPGRAGAVRPHRRHLFAGAVRPRGKPPGVHPGGSGGVRPLPGGARDRGARQGSCLRRGAKAPCPEPPRTAPPPGGRGAPVAQQRERGAPGAPLDRVVRARCPARGVRGRDGPLPLSRRVRRGALPLRRRGRGAKGPAGRARGRHAAPERGRRRRGRGRPAAARPRASHRVRR